jgi:hypothetical protein
MWSFRNLRGSQGFGFAQFAAEIAEHKRDPYDIVEQLIGGIAK